MSHLVWFVHRTDYFNFRYQELSSILNLPETLSASSAEAFLLMDLPDDNISVNLVNRAILVRAVVELWAEADSFEALLPLVLESGRLPNFVDTERSFCFEVFSHGRKLSASQQRHIMNYFAPIFQGDERADMDDPSCILCVLEFPIDNSGSRWFFGRQVAPFGRLCRQPENPRVCLALTNRPVLGPTTLDNDLAFLMTNVAEISDHKTQLVFDPFCGTAGLLLTATERGARTMGGELDFRVLYGWMCTYAKGGQERTDVALNFEHYGFARPEFVICDNAQPPWRANSGICDAVLTDTPYGVRAATKCTRTREEDEARGALQSRLVQYADEPLLLDLVNRAGEMLKTGGVLVFLMHLDLIDLLDESEIAEIDQKETKRMFIRNRPGDGRKTLYVSEASRLPALLDMERYKRLIPEGGRAKLRLESAGLQILTAGTGRLLVKMRKMEEIVS